MGRPVGAVVAVGQPGGDPPAGFTAAVSRASTLFAELTPAEIMQLPGSAARGMAIIKQALAEIGDAPAAAPAAWPPRLETKEADPGDCGGFVRAACGHLGIAVPPDGGGG
jgi:hypothetical protein